MTFEEILQKDIKRLEKEIKMKKPYSVWVAGMLAAREEPYCTIYDLVHIAEAMGEILNDV